MLYNQIMEVRCSPHSPALITSLQMGNCALQIALTTNFEGLLLPGLHNFFSAAGAKTTKYKAYAKKTALVGAISESVFVGIDL